MKISEIARRADVSKDTVRHYVSLGLLQPSRDVGNSYQVFGTDSLARLLFIRTARQLGFRLDDIRQIFQDAGQLQSPCPRVRELMQKHIEETRETIRELTLACARMESTLAEWDSMADSTPNGHSICRLIESQIPAGEPET